MRILRGAAPSLGCGGQLSPNGKGILGRLVPPATARSGALRQCPNGDQPRRGTSALGDESCASRMADGIGFQMTTPAKRSQFTKKELDLPRISCRLMPCSSFACAKSLTKSRSRALPGTASVW